MNKLIMMTLIMVLLSTPANAFSLHKFKQHLKSTLIYAHSTLSNAAAGVVANRQGTYSGNSGFGFGGYMIQPSLPGAPVFINRY